MGAFKLSSDQHRGFLTMSLKARLLNNFSCIFPLLASRQADGWGGGGGGGGVDPGLRSKPDSLSCT